MMQLYSCRGGIHAVNAAGSFCQGVCTATAAGGEMFDKRVTCTRSRRRPGRGRGILAAGLLLAGIALSPIQAGAHTVAPPAPAVLAPAQTLSPTHSEDAAALRPVPHAPGSSTMLGPVPLLVPEIDDVAPPSGISLSWTWLVLIAITDAMLLTRIVLRRRRDLADWRGDS